MPYCKHCGAEVPLNAMFCRNCGKPTVHNKTAAPQPTPRPAAPQPAPQPAPRPAAPQHAPHPHQRPKDTKTTQHPHTKKKKTKKPPTNEKR
ncbi:MAG: zinc ribbon domain-containing protein, partial [Bacteroidales bacterium]|nr:zinc ribbon domain-containing protein [Bacteroidales bacterium]